MGCIFQHNHFRNRLGKFKQTIILKIHMTLHIVLKIVFVRLIFFPDYYLLSLVFLFLALCDFLTSQLLSCSTITFSAYLHSQGQVSDFKFLPNPCSCTRFPPPPSAFSARIPSFPSCPPNLPPQFTETNKDGIN